MTINEAMNEFWNGSGGDRWVTEQARYDAMLDPLSIPLVEQLASEPSASVLDIGCGCGSLSLSIARSRSGGATVTGADISDPMLALARQRAGEAGLGHADFVHADAQTYSFEPEAFDVVVSRFGVMFFDDPVTAFSNIGTAVRPGGRLRCLVWQTPLLNEWVLTPATIIGRFLELPAPDPTAPGPWAFADAERVRGILTRAGWTIDAIDPFHGHLTVGGPSTLEDAVDFALTQGPLAGVLDDTDDATVATIRETFLTELAPRHDGRGLQFGYATWLIEATRA